MQARSQTTEIEKLIHVHYHMLDDSDRALMEEEPRTRLKRTHLASLQIQQLHAINIALPSVKALHDLITVFASKPQLRWLEIERPSLPVDTLCSLRPALTVMVEESPSQELHHHLCALSAQRNGMALPPTTVIKRVDLAQPVYIDETHRFDLVSCVGSLNRFFKTKESATQLFKNMATYLDADGYLVCVFRSGDHLLPSPSLSPTKRARKEDSSCVSVYSSMSEILKAPYGLLAPSRGEVSHDTPMIDVLNAYCVQPHQQDADSEYLVFADVVKQLARENGLFPVTEYPESVRQHLTVNSNTTATPFKRFVDTCYIAMVFKKK